MGISKTKKIKCDGCGTLNSTKLENCLNCGLTLKFVKNNGLIVGMSEKEIEDYNRQVREIRKQFKSQYQNRNRKIAKKKKEEEAERRRNDPEVKRQEGAARKKREADNAIKIEEENKTKKILFQVFGTIALLVIDYFLVQYIAIWGWETYTDFYDEHWFFGVLLFLPSMFLIGGVLALVVLVPIGLLLE